MILISLKETNVGKNGIQGGGIDERLQARTHGLQLTVMLWL